ncbi:MAG: hypothetical protein WD341_14880 [Tistlia sp.]|uniref:hypothetical protein n=1 Tax=Tistlia sp. TaxID=3057121 RepID=UPI0034A3C461
MVTGLLFLGACIGVIVVVFWMVANDKLRPDEPTRGLLAMREPKTDAAPDPGPQPGRERSERSPR